MTADHELSHMPEGEEPPPPGTKAMAIVRWLILAFTVVVAIGSFWSFARAQHAHPAGSATRAPKYQCPMHPQIVSDQPGECPICHMALEPITAERAAPQDAGTGPGSTPPGTAPVQLALDRVQAIGVRTAVAREEEMKEPLRVTAVVAPTDQGAFEVHVRAPGFVERLDANQTGVNVTRGQTLFLLYSPEIFQAQSELLSTRGWEGDAGLGTAQDRAKKKLELLGMAAKDIEQVRSRGEPMRAIPIYAPEGGYVAKKNVVAGSYVTPEMTLYEIQDLSRVYVIADVPQRDMAAVTPGLAGRFVPTGRPDASVAVKIDLVYPVVNVEARTTRVRMQVPNPKRALRPGDYGTVELTTSVRKVLVVPRDAVVDTGTATYVFVAQGEGSFVPRSVTLGGASGDLAIISAGLSPGERVVSGATFLIDSESRLRASVAGTSP